MVEAVLAVFIIIITTGYDPSQLDKNELRMMLVIIVSTRAEGRQRQCERLHPRTRRWANGHRTGRKCLECRAELEYRR